MKVQKINPNMYFGETKEKFTDKFYTHTKNAADINDTVVVPRTIFKGYLGFMAGTAMSSVSTLLNKHPYISKPLNIAGILTALYGTWAFVRPYVIKDAPGVAHKK